MRLGVLFLFFFCGCGLPISPYSVQGDSLSSRSFQAPPSLKWNDIFDEAWICHQAITPQKQLSEIILTRRGNLIYFWAVSTTKTQKIIFKENSNEIETLEFSRQSSNPSKRHASSKVSLDSLIEFKMDIDSAEVTLIEKPLSFHPKSKTLLSLSECSPENRNSFLNKTFEKIPKKVSEQKIILSPIP
ncbi:MAG: hypothetical protein CL678_16565 [Bdellovibrionaceae bacterium]|nr:hypothetical protein [Pseudobdellovibrionaceae bacterium]|tara:strand:+ start:1065 stop:1625 length:561 start_codon:yes stop_codon:yes gene_type:complete